MRFTLLPTFILLVCLLSCVAPKQQSTNSRQPTLLNHIALNVTDLQRSTRFYQQVLKLDTMPNPFNDGLHTWFALQAGSQLHLIQHPDIPTQAKGAHLCFSVSNMEASIAELNAMGMNWEDWPGKAKTITRRPDGVQQVYFRDPDGYWIELNDDHPGVRPR